MREVPNSIVIILQFFGGAKGRKVEHKKHIMLFQLLINLSNDLNKQNIKIKIESVLY